MNRNVTMFLAAILISIQIPLVPARAGHREGNGGDHVRATFIKMGQSVLSYLDETQNGAEIVARNGLSLDSLKETLNIERLTVVEGSVTDNGGSSSDATGVPGLITLGKDQWIDHFERQRDVYYLVFHEMLRSAAYHDDGYVISRALNPFPQSRQIVTRISSLLPLVGDELLVGMIDQAKIKVEGSGCPSNLSGTLIDFDTERNILDLSFERYRLNVPSATLMARSTCALAIPVSVPQGKRIVISQLDLAGKVQLPPGSTSTIRFESFLAGSTGKSTIREVTPADAPITGRVLIRKNDVLRSNCGGQDILRLNTSAEVRNQAETPAQAEVNRVSVYLNIEPCTSSSR